MDGIFTAIVGVLGGEIVGTVAGFRASGSLVLGRARLYLKFDIVELLGEPYRFDARRNLIKDTEKDPRGERLHYETLAALQVFLMHAELTTPA